MFRYRTEKMGMRMRKKSKAFIILLVLVLALTLPFLIKGRDGRPLISFDTIKALEISMPDFGKWIKKVMQSFKKKDDNESGDKITYRWKNAEGIWCYSNQPNPYGSSEVMNANREINVIDISKEQPKEDSEKLKSEEKQKSSVYDEKDKPSPETPISPLPILRAPELLEKAQELTKDLDKRTQDMEKFADENI